MTATIVPTAEYQAQLFDFVELLTVQQNENAKQAGTLADHKAEAESGRKYDRITITSGGSKSVRYFIERSTGNIYGAKSKVAPNLNWYFGNISRAKLWNWGGHFGVPVNDPSVRLRKKYGPYESYVEN